MARPISWKNSHANRTEITRGGRKRKDAISGVSSAQLAGRSWSIFIDVKKMTAADGDTVATYISQEGPNATTRSVDPVYRDGGVNGKSISFNGAQQLTFGDDVLPSSVSKISVFSAHKPVVSAGGKFILALGNPNYFSTAGFAHGLGNATADDYGALGTFGGSVVVSATGDVVPTNIPQVLSHMFNRAGTAKADKIKIFNNGNEESATYSTNNRLDSTSFETGAASAMSWGGRYSGSVFYDGNVSITGMLNAELTENDHTMVARTIMGRARI